MDITPTTPPRTLRWSNFAYPGLQTGFSEPGFCSSVLVGGLLVIIGRLPIPQQPGGDTNDLASACMIDYSAEEWIWVGMEGPCAYGCSTYLVKDKIFSLGGIEGDTRGYDLWTFDVVLKEWRPVEETPKRLISTLGHSAVYVETLDMVVVFGGIKGDFRTYSKSLYVVSSDGKSWNRPKCKGRLPTRRAGMGTALVGTDVYYFGGIGDRTTFRSLHILHCRERNSLSWSRPRSEGDVPVYGAGASVCYHQGRLIVFGGTDMTWSPSNACHLYDIKEGTWVDAEEEFDVATFRPGTFGHSAVMSAKGMLVVGGPESDAGTVYYLSSVE